METSITEHEIHVFFTNIHWAHHQSKVSKKSYGKEHDFTYCLNLIRNYFMWKYVLCDLYVCLVAQSCSTDHNPLYWTPPDSSVHEISQARILGWVALSFSRGSSWSRDQTQVSCVSWIAGRFFTRWAIPPIFLTLWIGQKALKHILLHNDNSEVCNWLPNLEYISKCCYGALD